MLPIIEDFVQRFGLSDFVIVADSGLMNQKNIDLLESVGYKYIIGARIKNENDDFKQWIFSLQKINGCFHELGKLPAKLYEYKPGTLPKLRLIVGYSENRAKKDRYNRAKGVKRLKKACGSGILTKESINKRGYNKFLIISDKVKVAVNQDKINEDEKWDGWKGYLTNTALNAKEVYEQYSELWVIERAYRVTKGTIELRPMFHFTPKRIEAHVCICFVAYKVYKELERILKLSGINLSVDKVLSIAKTITTLKIKLPACGEVLSKQMLLTAKHKSISKLFEQNFWDSI
jgi:transposase